MITPCILSTVAVSEEWTDDGGQHIIIYVYDAEGTPIGMQYRNSSYPANLFGAYWFFCFLNKNSRKMDELFHFAAIL